MSSKTSLNYGDEKGERNIMMRKNIVNFVKEWASNKETQEKLQRAETSEEALHQVRGGVDGKKCLQVFDFEYCLINRCSFVEPTSRDKIISAFSCRKGYYTDFPASDIFT